MSEEYREGFAPQAVFETFIVNTLMRLIGLFSRLVLIGLGISVWLITLALGPIIAIVWLGMPLWWLMLLVRGLTFLLS